MAYLVSTNAPSNTSATKPNTSLTISVKQVHADARPRHKSTLTRPRQMAKELPQPQEEEALGLLTLK